MSFWRLHFVSKNDYQKASKFILDQKNSSNLRATTRLSLEVREKSARAAMAAAQLLVQLCLSSLGKSSLEAGSMRHNGP